MTARTKILEAITGGKLLRVQTKTRTILIDPIQAGTIGGRWCCDVVVFYSRGQEFDTIHEYEIIAVQGHDVLKPPIAKTFENLAQRFDDGSLTKREFPTNLQPASSCKRGEA